MNKVVSIFMSLIMCMSLASCGETSQPKPEVTEVPAVTEAPALLDTMSLEEKVGQLLFVRCPDTAEAADDLMSKNPGGILMFQRDFDGLTKDEVISKIEGFQSASKIPLIIGVDEEGGTVVRVSANPNLTPEKYQSPQEIYKNGGMDALCRNTEEKSKLLKELGITINLAPVADVCQNTEDFMYERSMGMDAEETAECIKNIVLAMKANGISSCLKHFPGYGGNADTHIGSSTDERSAQSFRQIYENSDGTKTGGDFIPFQAGIAAGADCVLVTHNVVNSLDSENPASLSPVIHEILRGELGFEGVIMTDDIAMGAVSDMENVYVRAVNAGNDLLITTDYETGYNQILSAVQNGEISMETIDNAVRHVLKMKGEDA